METIKRTDRISSKQILQKVDYNSHGRSNEDKDDLVAHMMRMNELLLNAIEEKIEGTK